MKKTILHLLFLVTTVHSYGQNDIIFSILTDNYPQETSWEIRDANTLEILETSPTYTTGANQYPPQTISLPDGYYIFTIFDSASDGICCGYGIGNYSLTDVTTGLIIIEGGDFGSEESVTFPLPYVPPIGGCMDATAYNYNSLAEVDDGSCLYLISPLQIDLTPIASGFNTVVDIANAGDERLFLAEQSGQIKILHPETGIVENDLFLNITSNIISGGEQGLLGLTFHPNYASNGYFYVNYTKANGDSRISRFQVTSDPNVADISSEFIILEQTQPFANHNAGALHFGPDGYLYIPFGDGGSGGDPQNNAQSGDTWLGKMLRIDVDNTTSSANYSIPADNPFVGDPAFLDEIWSYGLRNVWRFCFDSQTGEMWMGDVGQNAIEEVDFEMGGNGGVNYGWRCYEGTTNYDQSLCGDISLSDVTMPVSQYDHSDGACAITGGYIYRGEEFPAMVGKYFFVDYCNGVFRSIEQVNDQFVTTNFGSNWGNYWTTFGEGIDKSIYASGAFGSTIYKLVDPCNNFQPEITIEESGDLVATEGLHYVWLIDGEISDSTNQTLTGIDLVSHTYQVSVTNAEGCGQLSELMDVVSVKETNNEQTLQVFPNPVKEEITLNSILVEGNFKVIITNLNGEVVMRSKNKKQIDVSTLASGMYTIAIKNGIKTSRGSFVKQ